LDYCGIDFGMDKNENIRLYESNSTIVIAPPINKRRWDYKRMPIENALVATIKEYASVLFSGCGCSPL
jgi:hypothetical protein